MPYGMDTDIAIGFQNSWDQSVTDVGSFTFIPYLSENVGIEIPHLISENMRGIYDEGDSYEGPKAAPGELEAEAQPIALGAMLKAMFGAPTSVQSDAIYTHTFLPATADFDNVSAKLPITYYKYTNDGGSASLFYNLNASNLELTITNGEFLKAKLGLVGGNNQQIAAVAATYETGKRWTWDVGSVSIDGSADTDTEELTLTFEDNIEPTYTINGSKFPNGTKRSGMRTVSVNGTMIFRNQTEYQKFLVSSEQDLTLSLRGTTEIQSGYYEDLTFQFPQFRYETYKPEASGPGRISVGISGKAKYNVTSVTAVICTLVNTKANW